MRVASVFSAPPVVVVICSHLVELRDVLALARCNKTLHRIVTSSVNGLKTLSQTIAAEGAWSVSSVCSIVSETLPPCHPSVWRWICVSEIGYEYLSPEESAMCSWCLVAMKMIRIAICSKHMSLFSSMRRNMKCSPSWINCLLNACSFWTRRRRVWLERALRATGYRPPRRLAMEGRPFHRQACCCSWRCAGPCTPG